MGLSAKQRAGGKVEPRRGSLDSSKTSGVGAETFDTGGAAMESSKPVTKYDFKAAIETLAKKQAATPEGQESFKEWAKGALGEKSPALATKRGQEAIGKFIDERLQKEQAAKRPTATFTGGDYHNFEDTFGKEHSIETIGQQIKENEDTINTSQKLANTMAAEVRKQGDVLGGR